MKALILANGESPSEALAQRLAAEHDLLLATDGAAHRAAGLGLKPDIICGDFDSVRLEVAQAEFPCAAFLPTPDQDQADLEKAIAVARDRGASAITILGAAGGRIDHTLANHLLLLRYHTEIPLVIIGDSSHVWAISGTMDTPGECTFDAEPGDIVSVLSYDGKARVTLTGLRWTLLDERLPIGTRGMSNVAESNRVSIRARGGAVIVCHLKNVPPRP
ncbi:MAG TPA: thiamine diphosphokinase [Chthonomonadaceae bacterium]|nr:thiamine diphosphokinase [Chthonomonadaceae bacterium]